MPSPAFAVSVVKKTRRAPHTVDLAITRGGALDELHLWPGLVPQLLAELEGSPLHGHDAAWLVENSHQHIGDVTLLKHKGRALTVRVALRSDALADVLHKGQAWQSNQRITARESILDVVWAPAGGELLMGLSNGIAELYAVTKKGLGRRKSFLNHPGLTAIDHSGEHLLTAGRQQVRLWDAKGKKVQQTLTAPAHITAAALVDGGVVVGLEDGAVLRLAAGTAVTLRPADGAPITALAVGRGRIAAAATGGVWTWREGGVQRLTWAPPITALALCDDGRLAAGSAEGAVRVWAADGSVTDLPSPDAETLPFYRTAFSPRGDRMLLIGQVGGAYTRTLGGAVTQLCDVPSVHHIQESPSGRYLVVVGKRPDRLYLFRRDGTLLHSTLALPMGEAYDIYLARFSPSERWLAVQRCTKRHESGAIVVLEVEGSAAIALPGENADYAWLEGMEWLDDDRIAAVYANEDHKVWTLSTRAFTYLYNDRETTKLSACAAGIGILRRDPDTLKVRDRQTLQTLHTLSWSGMFAAHYIPEIQLSSDGQRALLTNPAVGAVVASTQGEPWKVPHTTGPEDRALSEALLSPSGRWLAVRTLDDILRIWDVDTHLMVRERPGTTWGAMVFTAAEDAVLIALEAGLQRIPMDGAVQQLCPPPAPLSQTWPVAQLAFLPDGRLLSATKHQAILWTGDKRQTARCAGIFVPSADGERAAVRVDRGMYVELHPWL